MDSPMKEISFLVQGSSPEPYKVKFRKSETSFTAHCSCPAGRKGTHCKHRIGILMGQTDRIVSKNISEVATVEVWLHGTHIESAIQALTSAEQEYALAKKALLKAKKNLSNALRGEQP